MNQQMIGLMLKIVGLTTMWVHVNYPAALAMFLFVWGNDLMYSSYLRKTGGLK